MDPKSFCEAGLADLRARRKRRRRTPEGIQLVIVLAHFAGLQPSEAEFERALAELADDAEQAGHGSLANATRAILAQWVTRAAENRME